FSSRLLPIPSFPTRRSSDLARRVGHLDDCARLAAAYRPQVEIVAAGSVAVPHGPYCAVAIGRHRGIPIVGAGVALRVAEQHFRRSEEHTSELQSPDHLVFRL